MEPASPEGIAKMARYQWSNEESRMRRQSVTQYPKYFMYFAGELHFVATDVLRGLSFNREEYSPILQKHLNGRYKYEYVIPYNSKWLKRINTAIQRQIKVVSGSNQL